MNISAFYRIYCDPNSVFNDKNSFKPRNVFGALALQVIAPAVVVVFYYYTVNFKWLIGLLAEQRGLTGNPSALEMLSPAMLSGVSVISLLVMVPLLTVVLAAYLYTVSKAQGLIGTFWQWFAATVWASMPSLFILPLGVLALAFAADGRLPPTSLNPTSLNQLFLQLDDRSSWISFAESVTAPMLWTISLLAISYRVLAQASVNRSVAIAAGPFVVFYGIWALVIIATAAV